MAIDPRDLQRRREGTDEPPAPLAGTRSERMQRLQIGLSGIAFIVLLVGLADIVITRAQQTEATVVPEAALPSVAASGTGAPRDPLVDAGVVPELPAEAGVEDGTSPAQEGEDVPPPAPRPPLD